MKPSYNTLELYNLVANIEDHYLKVSHYVSRGRGSGWTIRCIHNYLSKQHFPTARVTMRAAKFIYENWE